MGGRGGMLVESSGDGLIVEKVGLCRKWMVDRAEMILEFYAQKLTYRRGIDLQLSLTPASITDDAETRALHFQTDDARDSRVVCFYRVPCDCVLI